MKETMKRIAAGLLSLSMIFGTNMLVFAEGDTKDTKTPEPTQDTKKEEKESTEPSASPTPTPTATPTAAPTAAPTPTPSATPEATVKPSETAVPAAHKTYKVFGVFSCAEDGNEVVKELDYIDTVSLSTFGIAEVLDGYTWNEEAYIVKSDGKVDKVTGVATDHYVKLDEESNEETEVFYDEVFKEDVEEIRINFSYTKAAEEEIIDEETEEETDPTVKEFFEEDFGDIIVRADAYDNANLPADAEIHADYIFPGSAEYITSVADIIRGTDFKELESTEYVLYDIYFTSNGERIEPNDYVKVTIIFKDALTSKRENGYISSAEVVHVDPSTRNANVVTDEITISNGNIEAATFTSNTFSPYGVAYTVDYSYTTEDTTDGTVNELKWSMEGDTTIALSDLFKELNIDVALENVKEVTFTNPELLSISSSNTGEWYLASMKPFTTEEKLTILLNDGTKYEIKVTDEQTTEPEAAEDEANETNADSVVLKVQNKITTSGGGTIPNDKSFTFKLTKGKDTPSDTPMPTSDTTAVTGQGIAQFESVSFTKEGTYLYEISVVKPETADSYYYSDEVVSVIVTVTKSEESDALTAAVEYDPSNGSADNPAGLITNGYNVGAVKLTKVFSGLDALPAKYEITNDFDTTTKFSVANAKGSGTAADPYTWTLTNVPANKVVTFTENNIQDKNYDLKVNNVETTTETATVKADPVTIGGTVSAAFNNEYTIKSGSLTIKQAFSGIDKLPSTFKIKNDFNSTVFTVDTASGSGTEENPYTWTISDVPYNKSVKFTMSGYQVDKYVTRINGRPYKNDISITHTVSQPEWSYTFKNVYSQDNASLRVTNVVKGTGGDTEKEFSYKVTLSDSSINGKYGSMDFTNGVYEFKLTHNHALTASELPEGVTYTVEESDYDGYYPTSTGATGTLSNIAQKTAAFTNYYTSLTVSNKVSKSSTATDANNTELANKEFNITVKLEESLSGKYGEMEFKDGVAEFKLKHSESIKATGLPIGTKYTITEKEANNGTFKTTYTGATGEITQSSPTKTASISNVYSPTIIKVTKKWVETTSSSSSKTSSSDSKSMSDTSSKSTDTKESTKTTTTTTASANRPASVRVHLFADGTDTGTVIELNASNNWTFSWTGLPSVKEDGTAIKYTVSEEAVDGYTATYSGSQTSGFIITNTQSKASPNTSDNTNLFGWGCSLAASMAASLISAFLLRKRRDEE